MNQTSNLGSACSLGNVYSLGSRLTLLLCTVDEGTKLLTGGPRICT